VLIQLQHSLAVSHAPELGIATPPVPMDRQNEQLLAAPTGHTHGTPDPTNHLSELPRCFVRTITRTKTYRKFSFDLVCLAENGSY
jgi:hypothetical protein